MRNVYTIMFLMGSFLCKELLAFEADAEHCSPKKQDTVAT